MADFVVLGAGNFGTCLAQHLAELGHQVKLWHRDPALVAEINQKRRNPRYLNFCELSSNIVAFHSASDLKGKSYAAVVFATPTQTMRDVLKQFVHFAEQSETVLICANKGIDMLTYQLPIDILRECLGDAAADKAVMLSGPSFATEVVLKQPTAVVASSKSHEAANKVHDYFHTPYFRVYTNDDPIGIEIAGALKNVIAIAVGAAAGFGFQNNSRAALMTRGLAEMMRLGVKMGAKPVTFGGLGGVGDLFLTCTSEKSRNYTVGFRLGRGEGLDEIVASVGSVAEGIYTTKAAYHLAKNLQVRAPITDEVYQVLYENKPLRQSIDDLISGSAGDEFS